MGWFRRRQVSVGLDIGSRYVKVVQVSHAGDVPEVSRIAMSPLPNTPEDVPDALPVVDAVAGLLRDAGLRGQDGVTGVGGHDVIVKRVELERMEPSELREVIRWEAEQHLPFDTADVELDFQILTPGDPMDVLLVAAKRDLVRSTAEVAGAAGLAVQVIDVDGFALYNALARNHPDATEGVVVLADIGWRTTTMVVVEEGIPAVTRDLPFGIRSLRNTVQREMGLSRQAAEAKVRGRETSPDLRTVIESGADEIAMGLGRAAAFLKTRPVDLGPGRVYLSGGGARIPGFSQSLGRILNVETLIANPFEQVPVRPDACVDVRLEEVAPMLQLSVGLALRTPARSRR